jgi:hypothetical protein
MNNFICGIVLVSGIATLGPVGAVTSTSLLKKIFLIRALMFANDSYMLIIIIII